MTSEVKPLKARSIEFKIGKTKKDGVEIDVAMLNKKGEVVLQFPTQFLKKDTSIIINGINYEIKRKK